MITSQHEIPMDVRSPSYPKNIELPPLFVEFWCSIFQNCYFDPFLGPNWGIRGSGHASIAQNTLYCLHISKMFLLLFHSYCPFLCCFCCTIGVGEYGGLCRGWSNFRPKMGRLSRGSS